MPSTAAASFVPSAVLNTRLPWSTMWFTGKMSGRFMIDTASRPTSAERSNAQHS